MAHVAISGSKLQGVAIGENSTGVYHKGTVWMVVVRYNFNRLCSHRKRETTIGAEYPR